MAYTKMESNPTILHLQYNERSFNGVKCRALDLQAISPPGFERRTRKRSHGEEPAPVAPKPIFLIVAKT